MSKKKINALTVRIEKIEKALAKLLGSTRTAKPKRKKAKKKVPATGKKTTAAPKVAPKRKPAKPAKTAAKPREAEAPSLLAALL